MTIDRLEVRLIRLRLVNGFDTGIGRMRDKRCVIVMLRDGDATGLGECTALTTPSYSAETTESAWHIITRFLAPRLVGATFEHPAAMEAAFDGIRGNHMAKAAVEMAGWDLFARLQALPLRQLLGGTAREIPAGASVGIQTSLKDLLVAVEHELSRGYRRIKLKIRPGWDLEPVAYLRKQLGDFPLTVDANGTYHIGNADALARLDPFRLLMIEQPLAPGAVIDHAHLQSLMTTPICLDESIESVFDMQQALHLRACQVVNLKPGRLGGHGPSIAVHHLCRQHGIALWHGGMLETGIGRAHNLHLASLPHFQLPADIGASERYFEQDIVHHSFELTRTGTIEVPDGPGIGVDLNPEQLHRATLRRMAFEPPRRAARPVGTQRDEVARTQVEGCDVQT